MLNLDKVMNWPFTPVVQKITDLECMLYALSVGFGREPLSPGELPFVYEKGLRVVPSMASVLGRPRSWMNDPGTGIDYVKVVHGEQGGIYHKPIPSEGTIVGRNKVTGVEDKGEGRGALVFSETEIWHEETGDLIAVNDRVSFCRGDGGCGSAGRSSAPRTPVPDRAPDLVATTKTEDWQALLYRLNGDRNPLHADPAVAAKAGFDRPILHGLCTYGIACAALLRLACGADPAQLKKMSARFSAPVMPGETIRTSIWRDGAAVQFDCAVVERGKTVLSGGTAALA